MYFYNKLTANLNELAGFLNEVCRMVNKLHDFQKNEKCIFLPYTLSIYRRATKTSVGSPYCHLSLVTRVTFMQIKCNYTTCMPRSKKASHPNV